MIANYTGAGARVEPDKGLSLDPKRYAFQKKIDGAFVRLQLDDDGAIASVTTRAGNQLDTDLVGIIAGAPNSTLDGEIEGFTEWGTSAARARGWANVHLFDCVRACGVDLTGAPYVERYTTLVEMQSELEQSRCARVETMVRDERGRRHDADGRFASFVPRDLRRLPIVELHRGVGAGVRLWDEHVVAGQGEGLVAVALDAPVGKRGAKKKIKQTDTIDAVVMRFDTRVAEVAYQGKCFLVGCAGLELAPGQVVEVKHDGVYASGEPRFARITRQRPDLGRAHTYN